MPRTARVICTAALAGMIAVPTFAEPDPAGDRDPAVRYQIDVEDFAPPVRVRHDDPRYSKRLQRAGIQGQVVLTGRVDADGRVSRLTTRTGHPSLARAAKKAVEGWEFEPAQADGRAIPVNLKVKVNFVLLEPGVAGAKPAGTTTSQARVTFTLPKETSGS